MMGSDAALPLSAIRSQIVSAIDIIVHLGRLRDRQRKVLSISEITGIQNGDIRLNRLYQFRERGETDGRIQGELESCGTLINTGKLCEAGLISNS